MLAFGIVAVADDLSLIVRESAPASYLRIAAARGRSPPTRSSWRLPPGTVLLGRWTDLAVSDAAGGV